jgi:hypothetical protein
LLPRSEAAADDAEELIDGTTENVGQHVDAASKRCPPEREGCGAAEGGSGEHVAWEVDAEGDPPDREDRRRDQGRDPPSPPAQQDRDGDRECRGGVVAGESRVGGVGREEVDAVGVLDEGPGAVDQFGDQLADRQGETGAEDGGEGGPPPRHARSSRKQEDEKERRDEQGLGGFDVEEQHVLDPVVPSHEVVQRVQQGPVHAYIFFTAL